MYDPFCPVSHCCHVWKNAGGHAISRKLKTRMTIETCVDVTRIGCENGVGFSSLIPGTMAYDAIAVWTLIYGSFCRSVSLGDFDYSDAGNGTSSVSDSYTKMTR